MDIKTFSPDLSVSLRLASTIQKQVPGLPVWRLVRTG